MELRNKQDARKFRTRMEKIQKADAQENVLKWIELAASKVALRRPALTWGYVRECLDKPALAASDGYRLHISWVGIENLPEWVRFKKSVDAGKLTIPNFPPVIPQSELCRQIVFSAPMLTAAVKCAQISATDTSAECITFNFDEGRKEVEIAAANSERRDAKAVIPIGGLSKSYRFNLNAQYLLDALKIWEHHHIVEMEFTEDNPDQHAILIGVRGYKMALIMPMSKP